MNINTYSTHLTTYVLHSYIRRMSIKWSLDFPVTNQPRLNNKQIACSISHKSARKVRSGYEKVVKRGTWARHGFRTISRKTFSCPFKLGPMHINVAIGPLPPFRRRGLFCISSSSRRSIRSFRRYNYVKVFLAHGFIQL